MKISTNQTDIEENSINWCIEIGTVSIVWNVNIKLTYWICKCNYLRINSTFWVLLRITNFVQSLSMTKVALIRIIAYISVFLLSFKFYSPYFGWLLQRRCQKSMWIKQYRFLICCCCAQIVILRFQGSRVRALGVKYCSPHSSFSNQITSIKWTRTPTKACTLMSSLESQWFACHCYQ